VRRVEWPIYHLALLQPEEARRRKVIRYQQESTRILLPDGTGLDERYYLPEDAKYELAAVPDGDRVFIERAQRRVYRREGRKASVESVTVDEVERFHPDTLRRGCGESAALDVLLSVLAAPARSILDVPVRVTNTGRLLLPAVPVPPGAFNVSYHILRSDRSTMIFDGLRAPVARALRSGEAVELVVPVAVPGEPGRYVLVFDLVHERYRWFGLEVESLLEVEPAPNRDPRRVGSP
jgi:hypothetical protein